MDVFTYSTLEKNITWPVQTLYLIDFVCLDNRPMIKKRLYKFSTQAKSYNLYPKKMFLFYFQNFVLQDLINDFEGFQVCKSPVYY